MVQNEYIKKSDVVGTLDAVIDNLKGFTAYEHPIAYGIRVGFIAVKDLIENTERGFSDEQTTKTIKGQTTP